MQRFLSVFLMAMVFAGTAAALDYEKAAVVSMRVLPCAGSTAAAPTPMGVEMPPPECSEYVLETSRVLYRIRPRNERILLPVGETVLIKLTNRELRVRMPDSEKEARFLVTEMALLRQDNRAHSQARAEPEPGRQQVPPASGRTCLARDGEVIPCDSR